MPITYQSIIREYSIIYAHGNLNLQDRGLLLHIYLNANPKTGIYMSHARRIAEEVNTHVETVRATQKRLKKAGLLVYKHSQTAHVRPYFLTGFILFKSSPKDFFITRSVPEILAAGRRQKIFPANMTESNVIEFIDKIGETWPNKFFHTFAKKVTVDTSILDSIPTISGAWGDIEIDETPADSITDKTMSEEDHKKGLDYLASIEKKLGRPHIKAVN